MKTDYINKLKGIAIAVEVLDPIKTNYRFNKALAIPTHLNDNWFYINFLDSLTNEPRVGYFSKAFFVPINKKHLHNPLIF